MLKELSKAKYQLVVGGKTSTIILSLGLKDELFNTISQVYQKFLEVNPQENLIPKEMQVEYQELQEKFSLETDAESRTDIYDQLLTLKSKLVEAATIQARQQSQRVQDSMLTAIRDFKYDIWALLLTKRTMEGEVTKEVTVEDLKTDPIYAEPEVEEALEQLLEVVLQVTGERLKKSLKTQQDLVNLVRVQELNSHSMT